MIEPGLTAVIAHAWVRALCARVSGDLAAVTDAAAV
jgi:hypothetical protein